MRRDADAGGSFAFSLLARLRPSAGHRSGAALLPTLRAYSGVRVPDARGEGQAEPLGRLGSLEIRLARRARDVRLAQKLRYHVFYEEMSAIADAKTRLARRDVDAFDAICEHLLVFDHDTIGTGLRRKPRVVGTYRLLRQEVAERHGGFYSAGEFAVDDLVARHPGARFLELGRSCVLAPYRSKRTVELLWHGIWAYVLDRRIDVMFGCASLDGTDPARLALVLSYLHHFHAAPAPWSTRALPHRRVEMNRMPKQAVDVRAAWRELPPLIKGYLRLGAFVGDGAVIDHQFGTTDVLIVLPVAAISGRYIQHFGPGAERHAA
ncbi:MAG: GNAT family N-acetyltransferase [Variibacter sp.]|nr:GNAT family N-acetyltransferase [Variibacter sp.]